LVLRLTPAFNKLVKMSTFPVSLPLPVADVESLAHAERDWDYAHGLTMNIEGEGEREKQSLRFLLTDVCLAVASLFTGDPATVIHAPHMLLPSPFPRSCYELGLKLACPFNTLYVCHACWMLFL
jgi:hypothetical protein